VISLSYSANLSDKWQMSHDVFYNTGNYQGNNDSERTMDHDGYGIRSKLNWKYANWGELLFGLDAIRQEANLDYNDYERIKGTKYRAVPMSFDYQKDIYGLYLLNTIKYGKWEFNQGVREELTRWWFSKTGKATSENGTRPAAGTPRLSFRALITTATRADSTDGMSAATRRRMELRSLTRSDRRTAPGLSKSRA
jgi:iron complex outermembrane receptor protein